MWFDICILSKRELFRIKRSFARCKQWRAWCCSVCKVQKMRNFSSSADYLPQSRFKCEYKLGFNRDKIRENGTYMKLPICYLKIQEFKLLKIFHNQLWYMYINESTFIWKWNLFHSLVLLHNTIENFRASKALQFIFPFTAQLQMYM